YGAAALHRRFLDWAASVGYQTFQPERLSRVDFTFDYQIPVVDFYEDNFVSAATKDKQFRKNRKVQTFGFGEGDVVLRVYNKVDEIQEKSAKTWFFDLWQCSENVWRIEWQIRKAWLRTFGIRTFADLEERQGDLLRVLVKDHTTLRIQTDDSNRSRWPVHPVWADLQARVGQMDGLGVVRELDMLALLEERETRMAISVYGYLKRLGAIHGIKRKTPEIGFDESFTLLRKRLDRIHDDLTWETDVRRRYDEMRLGQW
ncbi:MAG: phage/plasmid replication protein, partial [Kiritimatiellia bacterium]